MMVERVRILEGKFDTNFQQKFEEKKETGFFRHNGGSIEGPLCIMGAQLRDPLKPLGTITRSDVQGVPESSRTCVRLTVVVLNTFKRFIGILVN